MQVLYEYFKKCGIERFVLVPPISETLHYDDGVAIIQDARSAAFYAMGEALKGCKTVVLFVPGAFLVSTHAAITEAWFQKVNVVVVASFDRISDVNTTWMDRCVLGSLACGVDECLDYAEQIGGFCGLKGPALVNVVGKLSIDAEIDYSPILKQLSDAVGKSTKVTCYNATNSTQTHEIKLSSIAPKHRYGLLSKYVGGAAVSDNGYLCCPAECVLVDINIFCSRYANEKMKMVLLDKKGILKERNVDRWIVSNGWKYSECAVNDSSAFKEFCDSKQASILVVGG